MANRRTANATRNKLGPVKAAYDRVLATHPDLLDRAIDRGLCAKDPMPYVELGAKLGSSVVRDIVRGALQNVVERDPDGFKRALFGALRGRDGFRTLVRLGGWPAAS